MHFIPGEKVGTVKGSVFLAFLFIHDVFLVRTTAVYTPVVLLPVFIHHGLEGIRLRIE